MGIVRLGELVLRWCNTCNLPILKQKQCSSCGSETVFVNVTPPGDIRPGFDHDVGIIREKVSNQFGERAGARFIPDDTLVVLNRAPGLDTIDEIIVDGAVIGSLYFDILKLEFKVIMRLEGAARIYDVLDKGYVIVDDGAAKAISGGGSVLIPGILKTSPGIQKGDEIIVLDQEGRVVATGPAKMSSEEISSNSRGSAVKTRWYGEFKLDEKGRKNGSWADAISANRDELRSRINRSIGFIKKVVNNTEKPVVVSFSGGKDSLATLLLALDAGLKPELIFINTGLELPETVEFTKAVADKYGLELKTEDAGDSFWKYVDYFGPPGKDFRWCCKTSKLGPASKLIKKNYPDGVLSFIGQRAYESEPRSRKGDVWENPWVPGQYAASPIQKWTAMHIWLYLFSKNAPVNPWYERGLDRIGCFLCPASNISELSVIGEHFEGYRKWQEVLTKFAGEQDLNEKWQKYALWRWQKPPKELINLLEIDDTTLSFKPISTGKIDRKTLNEIKDSGGGEVHTLGRYKFVSLGGFEDCQGELSLEGAFDLSFDFERACNLLNILARVVVADDNNSCSVGNDITLFKNGTLSIRSESTKNIRRKLQEVFALIVRSKDCVECGVCVAKCGEEALMLNNGLINLTEHCSHCKKCLNPCTVTDFSRENIVEF